MDESRGRAESEERARIEQLIADAIAHHAASRVAEARTTCEEILRTAPEHPDALYLTGIAAYREGGLREAAEWIDRAIAANPGAQEFRNMLSVVRVGLGQSAAARAAFEAVLRLEPEHARARSNLALRFALGKMYDECGTYDRAFEHYRAANRARHEGEPFDLAGFVDRIERLMAAVTAEVPKRWRGIGSESATSSPRS